MIKTFKIDQKIYSYLEMFFDILFVFASNTLFDEEEIRKIEETSMASSGLYSADKYKLYERRETKCFNTPNDSETSDMDIEGTSLEVNPPQTPTKIITPSESETSERSSIGKKRRHTDSVLDKASTSKFFDFSTDAFLSNEVNRSMSLDETGKNQPKEEPQMKQMKLTLDTERFMKNSEKRKKKNNK
ncbi:hypothetical protein EHP00_262 [Ecytonucleospora hepatopenaei]|uniref:Uncharacterized protein n=1 Tax=Ecytonucleospora hepatopenaei TaxID=646526 RepID=A0A1W0E7E6_9MICR|nr:hypothetical protein EHP00_262 [Ecytonucleospora hepatopenaei]